MEKSSKSGYISNDVPGGPVTFSPLPMVEKRSRNDPSSGVSVSLPSWATPSETDGDGDSTCISDEDEDDDMDSERSGPLLWEGPEFAYRAASV